MPEQTIDVINTQLQGEQKLKDQLSDNQIIEEKVEDKVKMAVNALIKLACTQNPNFDISKLNDMDSKNSFIIKSIKELNQMENIPPAISKISADDFKNTSIDYSEKLLPFFSQVVKSQEDKINSVVAKNDTFNAKIQKNQDNIDKLHNKANSLKHTNSILVALKTSIPALESFADSMIEKNNNTIKSITEVKIPKREQKIETHQTKIKANDIKINKCMNKLNRINSVNKFLVNFKTMDNTQRREGFISGLQEISKSSIVRNQLKIEKSADKLINLVDKLNNDNTSSELMNKSKSISKLIQQVQGSKNKIIKMNTLIDNLDRILKGEVLQDTKKIEEVISTTEKAVSEKIAQIDIPIDNETQIIDTIFDTVILTSTDVIQTAIIQEQEVSKNSIHKQEDVLIREEHCENPNPSITEDKEQQILSDISSATGVSMSQLNSLPKDIKVDIISEYDLNAGKINSSELKTQLCDILNIEPPKQQETISNVKVISSDEKKENPLKTLEELIEGNANSIDGIINNIPKEVAKDELKPKSRFSRDRALSNKYSPKSQKQEHNNSPTKDKEMGL